MPFLPSCFGVEEVRRESVRVVGREAEGAKPVLDYETTAEAPLAAPIFRAHGFAVRPSAMTGRPVRR
jgi:hypothetical protein